MWGLGFREYRERWLTTTWEWYDACASAMVLNQQLTKAEAAELLQERRTDIAPYAVFCRNLVEQNSSSFWRV